MSGPDVQVTVTVPTLQKGDSGVSVERLQLMLNVLGGLNPPLDVDGDFGSLTEAAVKAFQKNNGLTGTGVVGPKSWTILLTHWTTFSEPS
jgi:peptidoglycan hydrolase-like protein with peptidoglycan-binding domain